MEKQLRRALIGVSIGHAAHDTWFGVAPVFLAAQSQQMGLSNSDIGLILLFYQGVSSITQPLFGRLSDRIGGRPLAIGAILWTTLMFSLAIFTQNKIALAACIASAGLGSGAWHPQGAANATVAGGERWGATAAAVFFLGGTMGTAFLGSALGGFLLGTYGRAALLLICVITVTLALTVVRATVPQRVMVEQKRASREGDVPQTLNRAFWGLVAMLLVGIAFRSLTQNSLHTYVPKYQQDLGASPAVYGMLLSLFLFSTAIGGVIGSYLADRLGLKRVLVGSLILAAIGLFAFVRLQGAASYIVFAIAGLCLGPSHTLFIVAGQRQFPQRMAMVSGIFIGFTFVSGAGGAWLLGLAADSVGLPLMFSLLPISLLLATGAAIIAVPGKRRQPAYVPTPAD